MKLPEKVLNAILEEANKNARFSWYSGWKKSSGYIKSELRGDRPYGHTKIYIKWEKKKEPTDAQIKEQISKYVDDLLKNRRHHQDQKEFSYYILNTYYVDVKRLQHEALLSISDSLDHLIKIIEEHDDFVLPNIQNLHNDLKNLQAGVNDHGAIENFLEHGKKRVGES